MWYRFLADVVVAVHVGYVSFVVVGLLLILVGLWRGWRWVRNPWFRVAHLTAIAVVALEAIFGIACPLTVWEYRLRAWGGQTVKEGTFIGNLLHNLIFYDLPPQAFTVIYVAFAVLVALAFFLAPPRRPSPGRGMA